MLMKSLIAVSLCGRGYLEPGIRTALIQCRKRLSVRLPNVIFGSLTAVVIFLLAQELFGVEIGLLSALLWSIGTIAIMVNRVAKEDTLLAFFTWLAYYFYLRAKKREHDGRRTGEEGSTLRLARASG